MNLKSAGFLALFGLRLAAFPQTIDDLSKVENNPVSKPPADIIPGPASAPAASIDSILVRPGFKVELFASEPLIQNPFAMAFDHLGRLWIAEAMDYPSTLTVDPFAGGDRIKILEDTDGDGKADKATVFADHLNLVSGLALVPEGVAVGMAPDIVLMTDKDGDDKVDEKRILYSGFGRGDTHGVLSNFQYGMDDWVYGTVGLAGVKMDSLGNVLNGMFRFKADGSKLEWVGNFPNNTWGLGINEAGQIFGSTANGQHAVYEAIADRYYRAAGMPPKTQQYKSNSTSRGVIWSLDHFIMEPVTKSVLKVDFLTEFTANTNA
jgi:putative membrane-bound dehydrogenase-like protein